MLPEADPFDTGMRHEFPGEVVFSGELPALPGAASLARRQAREVLGSWRVPAQAVDTAQLLMSEIVTNAVMFGGSGRADCLDSVGLVLRLLADELVIEVSDSNQVPPTLAVPDSEAESGRGLWLVDGLSRKWGFHPGVSGGKTVYCVVPI